MSARKKENRSGLGLDGIGDLSGLLNDSGHDSGISAPLELSLDLVDEDPDQPRTEENPGFSISSLNELAATIKKRGVKTPISVRENQNAPGRFIVNHGARRVRGSKIAGKKTIPAFIDNDYNEADQVIENLQRNELTSREIADFIGRELAKKVKKSDIASAIGKSSAFVSQHITLLDLPDPIAAVFNSGLVRDVTVVNELVKAHKKNPLEVENWLGDDKQEITRGSVKLLREYLDEKRKSQEKEAEEAEEARDPNTVDAFTEQTDAEDDQQRQEEAGDGIEDSEAVEEGGSKASPESPPSEDYGKIKKPIVFVLHDERRARLMLNKRPSSEGVGWIKYEDDGHEFEASLAAIELIALADGV